MTGRPPLSQDLWVTLSPEAQAAVSALVQSFERRIADLEERLNKDSTNSSKPPSSAPPSVKRRPPTPQGRSVIQNVVDCRLRLRLRPWPGSSTDEPRTLRQ